jgi:predicted N-acyltransferase
MVDGNKIIIIFYFIYCVCANYKCCIMPSRGPDLEINNKSIQVSYLQKAPRDGTKWRFIPTCAWCRIDTQFIWKICNRHQGCNFGFENYLSIVRSFEHRKNITKLRISAHKLQIEVGRYQGILLQDKEP